MTALHDASLLDVSPDAQGTRVEVPAGLGFVVADAVVVRSVTAGAAGFRASLRCVSWPVQLDLFRGTLPARGVFRSPLRNDDRPTAKQIARTAIEAASGATSATRGATARRCSSCP